MKNCKGKYKLTKAQFGLAGIGKVHDRDQPLQGAPEEKKQTSFWDQPLTLNWSHVLASQIVQGIGVAAGNNNPNSYENATLDFNKKVNPTSWLPQNPNTSQQALYGMQEGGEIIDDYIKSYIFGERKAPQVKQSSKQEGSAEDVTQEDVEQWMDYTDEALRPRQRSSHRIGRLLGESPNGDINTQGIDPKVQQATEELLAKFPGLRVTSGIRNWGDPDGHPKGQAMDVGGDQKIKEEAWKYYNENIVPKYGFKAALPLNHGTAPHIHVGNYQQGGRATTQDSLALYNNSKAVNDYYNKKGYDYRPEYGKSFSHGYVFESLAADKEALEKRGNWASVPMKGGTQKAVQLPMSQYHKELDENRFLQREAANNILDTRAPMQMFDKRIVPTGHISAMNNKEGDIMENDIVNLFTYDPISVKPWNMLTESERKLRIERYGNPNEQKSSKSTKTSGDRPRQNLNTAPDELITAYKRFTQLSGTDAPKSTSDPKVVAELDRLTKIFDKYKVPKRVEGNTQSWDWESLEEMINRKPKPKPERVREKPAPVQGVRPNINTQSHLPATNPVAMSQGKTDYSYTYRTEDGQQKSIYFPDWATWNNVVKDQPYIDAPTNAAKTYGRATGHYLKLQEGGTAKTYKPELSDKEIKAQKDFFKEYIQSPMYLNRLKKQGYKDPKATVKARLEALKSIDYVPIDDNQGSRYIGTTVLHDKKGDTKYGMDTQTTLAHEVSHGVGAQGNHFTAEEKITNNYTLNEKEIKEFENRNKLTKVQYTDGYYKMDEKKRSAVDHDVLPNESKADIDSLRFLLKRDKVYDAGKKNFTQEELDKAKKLYKDNGIKRLFNNFSDKDLIYLMNNIAMSQGTNSTYAQMGGIPNPVPFEGDSVVEALQHAEKLKMHKNGKFKAIIPMEWYNDDVMNYAEKLKFIKRHGEQFIKVRGSLKDAASPVPQEQPLPEPEEMHLGGSNHGVISKAIAKKILKDGEVEGHKLTAKQKHYFKHVASGQVTFKDGDAYYKGKEYQEGGLVNTTGYTEGSATENNPVNVIPSGHITMANVYSPVIAVPVKDGKAQAPVMMAPETDYTFDADHTIEFKAGGTYDLTPEHIEMLKKLGYDVEIL